MSLTAPLEFAEVRHPVVSVVVCMHDHVDVTLACLHAVQQAQRWNLTPFEVVLVDDASTEDTSALRRVRELRYVRLDDNVGFLRAANAGIAAARGTHVLLLNNDTLPQGTWLDELVGTLARRPLAGVVGARLVFPDGRVQEAGGIVFSDANGWNYGRGFDPDDPRTTFEREVDYCSGAALLVRGELMRTLGGFDERFVPAYYEDTDLCFAARAHGWQVWYQPTAIVVHLEGTSHGTDVTQGLKQYQQRNRDVFRDKWADELTRQHAPIAANVPLARWRSERGHVLVVDNEVPTPDRDSGSCRLRAVLAGMLSLGYGVTYLPFNGWRRPHYTQALERLGVEVLPYGVEQLQKVREMAAGLTHVWLGRPHVAGAVLPRVRADFPDVRVVYDTVDLHFLREQRQAALTGSTTLAARAAETRRTELAIADGADAVVVVSDYERALLADQTRTPVYVVPNVHDVGPPRRCVPPSPDLLFVGSFQHPPNQDAVEWFIDAVLPRVRAVVPEARLLVVGSSMPDVLQARASASVEMVGWVADLAPLYRQARAVVAPLRFGAGVKGKVGEALAFGVPTVMTAIAAEGMHIEHDVHALVADDPDEMAEQLVRLLRDGALWHALSAQGRALIADRFSPDAVRPLLAATLEDRVGEAA